MAPSTYGICAFLFLKVIVVGAQSAFGSAVTGPEPPVTASELPHINDDPQLGWNMVLARWATVPDACHPPQSRRH